MGRLVRLVINWQWGTFVPTCLVLIMGLCLFLQPAVTWGDTIYVAVATNFKKSFEYLASSFEKNSGHTLVISSGSSGKLFAQISNGAPFQLFLSADMKRPKKLQEMGLAVPGSLFKYATGRLVLWSPKPKMFANGPEVLKNGTLGRIALGNPRSVPYGQVAQETLVSLGLWDSYSGRMAFGGNVGQVLAFVLSGNADAGFVALSQILDHQGVPLFAGSFWEVPAHFYSTLEQGGICLKRPGARQPVLALMQFLRTPASLVSLERFGYLPP